MNILVIGGTSGIGRKVVDEAIARGHGARAMGRSADALPQSITSLEPFQGDALDADDVRRALAGIDAVVQALGIKESVAIALAGGHALFEGDGGARAGDAGGGDIPADRGDRLRRRH